MNCVSHKTLAERIEDLHKRAKIKTMSFTNAGILHDDLSNMIRILRCGRRRFTVKWQTERRALRLLRVQVVSRHNLPKGWCHQ
jgi:hypothetical protein